MEKRIAVILVACGLIGTNVYLVHRTHSLGQELDAAHQQISVLATSTAQGFNASGAGMDRLFRQLDARVARVEGKLRQVEGKVRQVSGLEYWSSQGNVRKVKLELDQGGDVNAKGENGYTALHAAAENGRTEVVRLLLLKGADTAAQLDSGETPLVLARMGNHNTVVRLLEGK
jgi:hypothetical protein